MTVLAFASEFPPATRETWRAAVDRVLKGGDFAKRLIARSRDDVPIGPIYEPSDAAPLPAGRPPGRWRIVARADHPDPAAANALLLAELVGGADAVALVFAGAGSSRGFGLPADEGAIARTLDGVMLDLVSVRVEAGPDASAIAARLLALAGARGHDPAALDLDLGLDPIGSAARSGGFPVSAGEFAGRLADECRALTSRGAAGRLFRADGRPFHEAGASEAGELASVLASALAYLRALESAGLPLEAARDALSFLLVADTDLFMTVAKLRALRRLWAEIESSCGLAPAPIRIAAETAWRSTTRRDPWVNILRGTVAAFAAGVGGADAVGILPFTAALGLPDAFARRVARNTQLILLEEAGLWRVSDPAAGAGGFEALTDALADEAWSRFGEIEREGGIAASLAAGSLQARLAAVRSKRDAAIATRREPITGTSEFADLRERPVETLMPFRPSPDPHPLALPSRRDAEPFEALRDRSDEVLARTGHRPRVFLANLGPVAAFTARSQFAKNAFEAVGIEVAGNNGFASLADMADAFRASGTDLACLCGSDESYTAEAVEAATVLREAGATRIVLAGRPGEREAEFRDAGIRTFVHVGSDVPAILGALSA